MYFTKNHPRTVNLKLIIKKYSFMRNILFFLIALFLLGFNVFAQKTTTTKARCYVLTDKYSLEKLFDAPLNTVLIGTIPGKKTVNVLEIDTIHYIFLKVQYKNKIGWIHKNMITDNSFMKNPRIRNEYKELVSQNKITIGMNPDEVIESWGYPAKKNTTITVNGTSEQWVYSVDASKYVYFENGIVSALQY